MASTELHDLGDRCTELRPALADAIRRAQSALRAGHLDEAAGFVAKAAAQAPGHPIVVRWSGMVAQLKGDHSTAIGCFRQVLDRCPDDVAAHTGLGLALFDSGARDQGIVSLRRACELTPDVAAAWFNLGEALKRNAQTVEASGALARAVDLDPSDLASRLSLARVEASLGNIDAAAAGFREVIRRDRHNAEAWFGLSNLKVVAFTEQDARQLEVAFARADLPVRAHALLGFALAKALEDRRDYPGAFKVLQNANASARRHVRWDAAAQRRRVGDIQSAFETGEQPASTDAGLGSEVIFIVSIPRSGSNLVEQILASHRDVEGANEITDLPRILRAETRRRGVAFPAWVPSATRDDWNRLGEDYLRNTRRWREHKPRFTDKNLANWQWVGVALRMLPAARVVVMRRDPLETCLSCYRQWFVHDADFSYDLDEMAEYCTDFLRLTRFWLRHFPTRVFDLRYERLVAEQEQTTRRLLDFCGLPFDQACLEFYRTERTVLSAPSASQVRQPLYADGARAAWYGDQLDGLKARLREADELSRWVVQ